MTRQTAFTVLELLIVLAIAALLMAVTFPTVQSWVVRAHLHQASSLLIEVTNEAKRRAVADGESWTIQFNPKDSRLVLTPTSAGNRAAAEMRQACDVFRVNRNIAYEFRSPVGNERISNLVITPYGTITAARICLVRNTNVLETFVTDRLTGDIRRTNHNQYNQQFSYSSR